MVEDKEIKFPFVKNISAKSIAEDIFPYIPGDKENMKVWDKAFKDLFKNLQKAFVDKGIPLPKIKIDYSQGPITYGIKVVDSSGNIIHTL